MQIEESLKKPIGYLAVILGLILVVYLAVLTWNAFTANKYIGRSEEQIYTITITGEGKVTAIPDIAQISLGLMTESPTVEQAQRENTEKMNNIIQAMGELEIAKEDIRTTNYNIYPNYDYNPTTGRQTLRNYSVSQSVNVKIRNLESVGEVIERAGTLGVNQVSGLSFTIDEPEELKQQARIKALENAAEKANSLASVANVKIGKLVSFSESQGFDGPVFRDYAFAEGMGGGAAAPQVEPGSQDVIMNVTVTYEVL